MSREGKLAKNSLILAIGTFLPKLAQFVTLPILTGYLSKDDYGTYDLIIILASLLLPAVTLRIDTASFRFLIDDRNDVNKSKSIITNNIFFIIVTSIIALIVLFFCLFKLPISTRLLICLYFLLDIYVSSLRQISRGLSQNLKYSISAIISAACQLIFVVVFVYLLKFNLNGSILALTIAELCSILFLNFSVKIYKYIDVKSISKSEIKRMLTYSWPMVPNSMSMWVMRVSDRLVVTLFMGVSANAVYAVANKIPQLLTLAQNTFTMAWQENASIVSKDKDASKYYSNMFKMMLDLMAGAMCLIVASTPILFKILIRGNYTDAYVQIPILILAMFYFSMSSFLGGIYVAYMKTKSVGITTIISAIINIVIDVALIHFIGLFAASLSTLISYVFLFFFRLVDVQKIIKVDYSKIHLSVILILTIILTGIGMIQNRYFQIINVILACTVFVFFNREFLSLLSSILKKKVLKR